MMKPQNLPGLLFMMSLSLYACTKVINVNLNDTASQIVIEGNVTNTVGPYRVQVTKTVNFSESNIFPPVSGAVVKITDNTSGLTETLKETFPGIYTTSTIEGVPGHAYQLYVSAGGQVYTSSSVMPQPVPLDSVTFEQTSMIGTKNINAVVNFHDPAGIASYYTFNETINSVPFNKSVFEFSDRLSDGRYITQRLFTDSAYINAGDTVMVQMQCVDKNVWSYFNTLDQVIGGNNFQSASPSNPLGNINNNALGYFSAHTVQSKTRVAY
jgi:hypothetical protein